MPGEVTHHAVVEALRVGLDHSTDDTQRASRPDRSDSAHRRLVCALDEQARLLAHISGEESRVRVAVDASDEGSDVDIADVAVEELRGIGDAVADDLVQARTQGFGIAAITEGRWVRTMVDEELVADSVELIGRDSWTNVATDLRQGVRGDPSGDPHCFDGRSRLHVRSFERRRRRTVDVLRAGDRGWH